MPFYQYDGKVEYYSRKLGLVESNYSLDVFETSIIYANLFSFP